VGNSPSPVAKSPSSSSKKSFETSTTRYCFANLTPTSFSIMNSTNLGPSISTTFLPSIRSRNSRASLVNWDVVMMTPFFAL